MLKSIKWMCVLCVWLSIVGCDRDDDYAGVIIDNYGKPHFTLHYSEDKRGRNHFPETIKSPAEKLFIFDPKVSAWAAYDADGTRVMTGRASGGANFCADIDESCRTLSGMFHIYRMKGKDCRSKEFPVDTGGGARMPYCMYFYNGSTIHAGYGMGGNGSHGCIRVLESAAKWLNEEFIERGTKVYILSYDEAEIKEKKWLDILLKKVGRK